MRAVRPLRGTALTALLFSLSFAPTAIAQFDDEFLLTARLSDCQNQVV